MEPAADVQIIIDDSLEKMFNINLDKVLNLVKVGVIIALNHAQFLANLLEGFKPFFQIGG